MRSKLLTSLLLLALTAAAQAPPTTPLALAKRALATRDFRQARSLFANVLSHDPKSTDALLGLADAETGLHQYLPAERDYRRVTAAEPQQWFAHKNLVIVEAALGRWEDFDTERAVLRAARLRHAPGLSLADSDVIDTLDIAAKSAGQHPQHWIVRDYATPLGRTATLYNFERFSPAGRVEAYVSLESATALEQELTAPPSVAVGNQAASTPQGFALNAYDGKSHRTLATYPTEPTYERIRTDFLRWARAQK